MNTNVPLREREGFGKLGMRAMYAIAYPFFHCKCHISDEVKNTEEPVVFVCNHYEVFGPLAVMVSMRMHMRFWMSDSVLHASENEETLAKGLHEAMSRLAQDSVNKIFNRFAKFGEKVFQRLDPISVDRSTPMKLFATMRKSVADMKQGNNIVIFPEMGEPHYSIGSVTPFFDGFAMLGEFYRRGTGKQAQFCPVYVDKWNRTIRFGDIVRYEGGDLTEESRRVSHALHDQLVSMAQDAHPELKEFQPEAELSFDEGEQLLTHRT